MFVADVLTSKVLTFVGRNYSEGGSWNVRTWPLFVLYWETYTNFDTTRLSVSNPIVKFHVSNIGNIFVILPRTTARVLSLTPND